MNSIDFPDDPVLGALRGLRAHDVTEDRARRLRGRCHRALRRHAAGQDANVAADPGSSRSQRAARLLAGAWCCVYLFETIRRAAAVYRLE